MKLCIQDLKPALNGTVFLFVLLILKSIYVSSLALFYTNSLQLSLFTNRFLSLIICYIDNSVIFVLCNFNYQGNNTFL